MPDLPSAGATPRSGQAALPAAGVRRGQPHDTASAASSRAAAAGPRGFPRRRCGDGAAARPGSRRPAATPRAPARPAARAVQIEAHRSELLEVELRSAAARPSSEAATATATSTGWASSSSPTRARSGAAASGAASRGATTATSPMTRASRRRIRSRSSSSTSSSPGILRLIAPIRDCQTRASSASRARSRPSADQRGRGLPAVQRGMHLGVQPELAQPADGAADPVSDRIATTRRARGRPRPRRRAPSRRTPGPARGSGPPSRSRSGSVPDRPEDPVGSSMNDRLWSTRSRRRPGPRRRRRVDQPAEPLGRHVHRHRVDGEVAPVQVALDRGVLDHGERRRPLVVLGSRGGHPPAARGQHHRRAELLVHVHPAVQPGGQGAGGCDAVALDGDIDVERRLAEQDVAHGTAHQVDAVVALATSRTASHSPSSPGSATSRSPSSPGRHGRLRRPLAQRPPQVTAGDDSEHGRPGVARAAGFCDRDAPRARVFERALQLRQGRAGGGRVHVRAHHAPHRCMSQAVGDGLILALGRGDRPRPGARPGARRDERPRGRGRRRRLAGGAAACAAALGHGPRPGDRAGGPGPHPRRRRARRRHPR